MEIINTKDIKDQLPTIMVFGAGGSGKSTFAATFPKPLIVDFEGGTKFFSKRGINVDTIQIKSWFAPEESAEFMKDIEPYETIVIDPVGVAMDMILEAPHVTRLKSRAGGMHWQEAKDTMKRFLDAVRKTGKNVVIVAHVEEKQDGDLIVKRPKIVTKLSEELFNMVDIVAYMIKRKGERYLVVDPADDKIPTKDRTGKLEQAKYIKPDYKEVNKIINK